MNDIVKYTEESGAVVQFTAQDLKERLCPNATDQDIAFAMALCQAQKLNPFTKDVHIIKYGNAPAQIITSKDVFSKRANANPNYEGFEAGVVVLSNGKIIHREGSAVYKAANEQLLGGWCKVFVKGKHPFYDEVTLDEYSTGKSNWAKMPATMIRKVAYVHCLREAFPDDFQGLYTPEEMGKPGDQVLTTTQNDNVASEPVSEAESAVYEVLNMEEERDEALLDEFVDLAGEFAVLKDKRYDDVIEAVFNAKSVSKMGEVKGVFELSNAQLRVGIALLKRWIEESKPADGVELAEEDVEF